MAHELIVTGSSLPSMGSGLKLENGRLAFDYEGVHITVGVGGDLRLNDVEMGEAFGGFSSDQFEFKTVGGVKFAAVKAIAASLILAGELAAGVIYTGTVNAIQVNGLNARIDGRITAATISTGQIDGLMGTDGKIAPVNIPNLSASIITSGTLDPVRIPNLAASKITSGTFDPVLIPNLSADKITTGSLSVARVGFAGSTIYFSTGITFRSSSTPPWTDVHIYSGGLEIVEGMMITDISPGQVSANFVYASGGMEIGGNTVATQSWVTSMGYVTSSALSGYATQSWVTSQNYITPSALSGYATQSWVTSQGYVTSSHTHAIANVTGLQTALDGKASKSSVDTLYANSAGWRDDIVAGRWVWGL